MFSNQKFNLTMLSALVAVSFSPYASAAGEFKTNSTGIEIGLPGSNAHTRDDTGIAIGKNAFAWDKDASKLPNGQGGIAIGNNAIANQNGIHIGNVSDPSSNKPARAGATVVGTNSVTGGVVSTIVGMESVIKTDTSVQYSAFGKSVAVQGTASTVTGAYNKVMANSNKTFDGVGVLVNGSANTVEASNGVMVSGVGNKVTNSYKEAKLGIFDLLGLSGGKFDVLANKELGSVMVNGGGNTVDYANASSTTGIGNTLKGKEGALVTRTSVNGYKNSVTESSNTLVTGNENTVTKSDGTILFGNKATLNEVKDSILFGHNITVKDNAEKVVALGDSSNVQVSTGVALGASATADRAALDENAVDTAEANVDAANNKVYAMDKAEAAKKKAVKDTVKGKLAAVSVGSSTATRQITNLAAGSADSDAVNVAQLNSVASVVKSNSATIEGHTTQITQNTNTINQHSAQINQNTNTINQHTAQINQNTNTINQHTAQINQNTNVINQNTTAINELRSNVNAVKKELRAGVAGAIATAGLPQAYTPGKSMVAATVGGYRDQSALAVGASHITNDGKVVFKLTGNANTRGDIGGSIGAGYQW